MNVDQERNEKLSNGYTMILYVGFLILIPLTLNSANAGNQERHVNMIINNPPLSADEIRPVLIGQRIPIATLTTSNGDVFDLNDAISKKPSVLIFYRGGWCPYCNVQLGQIQSVEAELIKLGYQILAISPDRPDKLRENMEKKHLTYTLLSDSSMTCAEAFGLAFKVDDTTISKYKSYNINLEEASGENHHLLPVPAAFIVGTDEIIKFEYVNPNYKVRIDPDVLIAAAKAALK